MWYLQQPLASLDVFFSTMYIRRNKRKSKLHFLSSYVTISHVSVTDSVIYYTDTPAEMEQSLGQGFLIPPIYVFTIQTDTQTCVGYP